MITSTIVVVIFYLICYFVPTLYVAFLKNNEENSETPIEGFHKRNALLFLFVLLSIVLFIILLLIIGFARGINILWDNGEMMQTWVSLALALCIGYAVLSLYFLLSSKDIQKKIVFRLNKNEDDDDNEDEEWQSTKIMYRMFLALVMSIFLLSLALQSLFFSKNLIVKFSKALLYLLAIPMLFVSLEWLFTIPIFIALTCFVLLIDYRLKIVSWITKLKSASLKKYILGLIDSRKSSYSF